MLEEIIMEQEELEVLERFTSRFQSTVSALKDHLTLFDLPEEKRKQNEQTIAILEDKLRKIKKAKSKKELKKVLRVNKLLKDEFL